MKDFNTFLLKSFKLAGDERFELPNDGVRVRCLTAWRIPNFYSFFLRYFIKLLLFWQAFSYPFPKFFHFSLKKVLRSPFSFPRTVYYVLDLI